MMTRVNNTICKENLNDLTIPKKYVNLSRKEQLNGFINE